MYICTYTMYHSVQSCGRLLPKPASAGVTSTAALSANQGCVSGNLCYSVHAEALAYSIALTHPCNERTI